MGGDGYETTGPGDDFSTTGNVDPCLNKVCQPDSWCCDGVGICISRDRTSC